MNKLSLLTTGIFRENPLLIMAMGICPALLIAKTAQFGIVFGVSTLLVLTISSIVLNIFKSVIVDKLETPIIVVLVSGLTSIVAILLKGYYPVVYEDIGNYLPLIAVNCIVLESLTFFPRNHTFFETTLKSVGVGTGYLWVLVLVGGIRELLASGTFFGEEVFIVAEQGGFFAQLPGGLLVLGTLMAFSNWISRKIVRRGTWK